MTLAAFRLAFERLLETIVVVLVAALTALVIAGFVFRYVGYSLSWYDETASVGLVWLTYYGSALAALKGAHIGVPGFVNAMPRNLRVAVTIFAEACVFLFFIMLAWTGFDVLVILGGDGMVSLPWVPLRLTDSVIPIGAVLFLIAETLRLPQVMRDARRGDFVDTETIEAIAHGAPAANVREASRKAVKPAARRKRR
ncbi:MAG: TRAP transporter small permease [Pseudolabrys sp.]